MAKKMISIILSCLISNIAFSQTLGCVSDDTGFMYPNAAYGTTYEPTPVGVVGTGDYCRPTYKGNCRIRSRSNCRNCIGPVNEGSWWRPDYWYYQSGKEYRYIDCPIDKNVGYMVLCSGILGFILVRTQIKL